MKDYLLRKSFYLLNKISNYYPPIEQLAFKHVENCKMLPDRFDLLRAMPKNSVCAEIGVAGGGFSEKIMELVQPKRLSLVDLWGARNFSERYYNEDIKNIVLKKFEKEIASKRIDINRGFSFDVLKTFPDNQFDWVYIDTDHFYDTTVKELEAVHPKMKADGIICGHDYIQGQWNGGIRYGVVEAVNSFCIKYNYQFVYLTMESHMHHSFAIQKIK